MCFHVTPVEQKAEQDREENVLFSAFFDGDLSIDGLVTTGYSYMVNRPERPLALEPNGEAPVFVNSGRSSPGYALGSRVRLNVDEDRYLGYSRLGATFLFGMYAGRDVSSVKVGAPEREAWGFKITWEPNMQKFVLFINDTQPIEIPAAINQHYDIAITFDRADHITKIFLNDVEQLQVTRGFYGDMYGPFEINATRRSPIDQVVVFDKTLNSLQLAGVSQDDEDDDDQEPVGTLDETRETVSV